MSQFYHTLKREDRIHSLKLLLYTLFLKPFREKVKIENGYTFQFMKYGVSFVIAMKWQTDCFLYYLNENNMWKNTYIRDRMLLFFFNWCQYKSFKKLKNWTTLIVYLHIPFINQSILLENFKIYNVSLTFFQQIKVLYVNLMFLVVWL